LSQNKKQGYETYSLPSDQVLDLLVFICSFPTQIPREGFFGKTYFLVTGFTYSKFPFWKSLFTPVEQCSETMTDLSINWIAKQKG
jgi:hypothetical protein